MWNPPKELTRREQRMLKRRTKKLFGFLREHRHELFDDAFQEELPLCTRRRAWIIALTGLTPTGDPKNPYSPPRYSGQ
jgi:hypothetical protein